MNICQSCRSKNSGTLFCRKCGSLLLSPSFRNNHKYLSFAFLLALLSYVFFYGVFPLPYLSYSQNYLYRIFTNHIICRIIAFLFFWGFWFSLYKLAVIRRQKTFFEEVKELDIRSSITSNRHPADAQKSLEHFIINSLPKKSFKVHTSLFIYSIYEIIRYKSVNIETHINDFFSDLHDRIESGFSIIRVFIWILPILGFLGTILGITRSIDGFTQSLTLKDIAYTIETAEAGSDIQQVFSSLTRVTDGLRTAFDTTFIGLFLVIPLMIIFTILKNKEIEVINEMELYIKKEIIPWIFPLKDRREREDSLDSLHSAFIRLIETNSILAENLQILCLKIDEISSTMSGKFQDPLNLTRGDYEEK